MVNDTFWPGFFLLVIVVELYRPSMAMLISSHLLLHLVFMSLNNSTLDAISFVFRSVIALMFSACCFYMEVGYPDSLTALRTGVSWTGVSWRPIVRPTLVFAAFGPGLYSFSLLYAACFQEQ